ncbi:capsular polysaccharide synthesis protein [Pediococcus ethanolidurans]|uniref:capsular polysaccharide synthesis protein n=1 Tax=Pediococcus ethanolidurans TaxID=319653 RepID=UPI0021E73A31|nr:capsular polysaccharide synthesis protein [Pediococcus ethanolidurans]MCV3327716.1 capsular polysaccharide synthesis protein [Pediococcus ethanolidurans]
MKKKVIKALKTYTRAGKLPLMVGLAPFFIGGNKKKLEIFRERINQSIHDTLLHEYYKKRITANYSSHRKVKIESDPIWFMWLQGIDAAPALSQANYNYLVGLFGCHVHLITVKNVLKYVEIPQFIVRKWKKGKISNTHFSDIIRIQLLCTYGGTWIDSTVIVKKNIFQTLPDFEIPQTFKPGSDGNVIPVSNWFMHAKRDNIFNIRVRDLLFEYWKNNDFAIDYFIFHHFLIIASKEMNNYLDDILPMDNTIPHYLMLRMRRERLSVSMMEKLFDEFSVMKFTNKYENKTEIDNYLRLIEILKQRTE